MSGLSVTLDQGELSRLLTGLNLAPGAIDRALVRATWKTARTLNKEIAAQVRAEAKIPSKVTKRRLKTYRKEAGAEQKIWLGVFQTAAGRLGKPRQVKQGRNRGSVVVAGRSFPGAFIMKNAGQQPGGGTYDKVMQRTPDGMREVKVDWSDTGRKAMQQAAAGGGDRLKTVATQEINFELQKALGRIVQRAARRVNS